jgi:hypothetical protein
MDRDEVEFGSVPDSAAKGLGAQGFGPMNYHMTRKNSTAAVVVFAVALSKILVDLLWF